MALLKRDMEGFEALVDLSETTKHSHGRPVVVDMTADFDKFLREVTGEAQLEERSSATVKTQAVDHAISEGAL